MILYFSGTGNSEYVAKKIEKGTGISSLNLFHKIKEQDFSELYSEKPWIIVVPTYAWRIPKIVENWILNTTFLGNKDIYFIMTCGDSIGNAQKYLKTLCQNKSLKFMGCMKVKMPENYIAMFKTPTDEEANQIIESAKPVIDGIINKINDLKFLDNEISFLDKVRSSLVNNLFYPVFVKSKKFYATDKCISCQKCVGLCPLNNIFMDGEKPLWKNNCTHCMACISRCPTFAIEYGKATITRNRYVLKNDTSL